MNQLVNELQFGSYDGKADSEFNRSVFDSIVSEFADYTGQKNARDIVRSFMPVSTIIDELSGYEQGCSLAAYNGDEVVALTCITPFKENEYLVSHMEVLKKYRGLGIGSILLNKAKSNKKPCNVYVSVHRENVQSFYLKNGFSASAQTKLNLYGLPMEFHFMRCI